MNLKITGLKLDKHEPSSGLDLKQPDGEGGKEPEKSKRKKVLKSASNPATGTVSGSNGGGGE